MGGDVRAGGQAGGEPSTAAPHPEEMRATVDIRIGRWISVAGTARATPAGLVAVAILMCSILVPVAWSVRARAGERGRG